MEITQPYVHRTGIGNLYDLLFLHAAADAVNHRPAINIILCAESGHNLQIIIKIITP